MSHLNMKVNNQDTGSQGVLNQFKVAQWSSQNLFYDSSNISVLRIRMKRDMTFKRNFIYVSGIKNTKKLLRLQ